MNAFNDFFEHMQDNLRAPIHTLKFLTFSIRQNNYFPNLHSLEIYFTVERSFDVIANLIHSINKSRDNRTCNPGDITFREYLTRPMASYSKEEITKNK